MRKLPLNLVIRKPRPLTSKEILGIKKLLQKGRNRYDNALLDIEKVWQTLKPHDYDRRAKLVKAALRMAKIDQDLKVWEQKLISD